MGTESMVQGSEEGCCLQAIYFGRRFARANLDGQGQRGPSRNARHQACQLGRLAQKHGSKASARSLCGPGDP